MSWLADIAGKAETFLIKIDANAAVLVEAAADEIQFHKNDSLKHGVHLFLIFTRQKLIKILVELIGVK